jgi:hypothetical protein
MIDFRKKRNQVLMAFKAAEFYKYYCTIVNYIFALGTNLFLD